MTSEFFGIRDKKRNTWFTTNCGNDFETSKEFNGRYLYSTREYAEKDVELYADFDYFELEIVPITLTWVEHE